MRIQRWIKEPFCGLSHFVGAALSIAGLVALLVLADGRAWHVVGFAIYGASLILLYLSSAMAHSLHCSRKTEDRLTRLDYIAIFLLIAGTYTPLCLIAMRGPWGWSLLSVEWGLAFLGIFMILIGRGKRDWPRAVIYLAMAWLCLVAIVPMWHSLSATALAWLFAGGVVYSVGAVIFATGKPRLAKWFSSHDLWHALVLIGSTCHFMTMLQVV